MSNPPPQDQVKLKAKDGKGPPVKVDKTPKAKTEQMPQAKKAKELQTKIGALILTLAGQNTFKTVKDNTKDVGEQGPGPDTLKNDQLKDVQDLPEQIVLLRGNNIDIDVGAAASKGTLSSGEMPALVLDRALRTALKRNVRFGKVQLLPPDDTRTYNSSISYDEFEASLQQQSVSKSELGAGIPGIFKVDATYSRSSLVATHERRVKIYFQASQILPKVKISLNQITFAPEFVAEVEEACRLGKHAAGKLLDVREDHGHFVPMSIISGGRLTLHTSTELNDREEIRSVERELKAAAVAEFAGAGLPVPAGNGAGGFGQKDSEETSRTEIKQEKGLLLVVEGGVASLADSQAANFGRAWMPSVGPYTNWQRIGYNDRSLVPIISLLPGNLSELCMNLLREYFLGQLDFTRSSVVGAEHGDEFGHDMPDNRRHASLAEISKVRRITEIRVKHGENVDGLQWTYELFGAGKKTLETGNWIGAHYGNRLDSYKLNEGEEIVKIEAGLGASYSEEHGLVKGAMTLRSDRDDRLIRRLAFITNRGRRFPDVGFFGQAKVNETSTIEVPRVKGFFGWKGGVVHSIGLNYLRLAANAKSRAFLLAMEPYLFDDEHDYHVSK